VLAQAAEALVQGSSTASDGNTFKDVLQGHQAHLGVAVAGPVGGGGSTRGRG
jgi:hypothetical protein